MSGSPARARRVAVAVAVLAALLCLLVAAPAMAQTPGVTLTVSPTSLAEDAGATDITVTATLSDIRSGATTVTLSLAGTATQGTDYTVSGTLPSISIPSGDTTASVTLVVTPRDDTFWEGDTNETIQVNGSATGGLTVTGAELEIEDDESRPGIELAGVQPDTLVEAAGTQSITLSVRLTGGATFQDATVITLSLSGSATQSTDYSLVGELPDITIPAGGTAGQGRLDITIVDDSILEPLETIVFSGIAGGESIGDATIAIHDNEVSAFQLSINPTWVREQSGTTDIEFTITRLGAPFATDQTVSLDVSSTAVFDQIQPSSYPHSIEFPAASSEVTVTVTATATSDHATDRRTFFTISHGGVQNDEAAFFVATNDAPSLSRVHYENGNSVFGQINSIGDSLRLWAYFQRELAFSGRPSLSIKIGQETRSATCQSQTNSRGAVYCTYDIQAGDLDLDGVELEVDAFDVSGLTVTDGFDPSISLSLVSVDYAAIIENFLRLSRYPVHGYANTFELLASLESLQEGAGATQITLTATQAAGHLPSTDLLVPIEIVHETTDAGDFTVSGTMGVTVPAGTRSGSTTLTFTPTEDGLKEARTESFRIGGGSSDYYVVGTGFTIIDSPTIQLTVPSVSVAENGGAQTVTVTAELGDPSDSTRGRPIVVSLNLSGSAGPGDYTFAETLQVTIPAGARSGSASFTLTPEDDRLLEGDETIVVSGSTPALTVVGTGTITIEDDETAPEVILTANPDTIQEDDSVPTQITVSAVLDPNIVLPDDATVVTLTLGGTATAGTGHDYTSAWNPQLAQITIPQGEREAETTVTLTVTPLQDEVAEGEETIVVEGTASTGLVVDVRGSVITVVDDDIPGIVLEPKSIEITEGGTASYTVALALEPTETVTVTMTTALGATDLSVDITELYFTPENWNQPQTVNVDAMEDVDAVADDTVTLVHEASGGAYEGVTSEATVTIKENDAPNVTVSSTALQILEGMNGMYSVVLTSQPTGDVTVTMDTDLANTDLSTTPSPTELTFTTLNWNQPQTVTVSAAVDADAVDDPAVTLEHSVSGGDYGGVTVSSVTVTIIEQSVPTLSVTGGSAQEGASVDFVVTLSTASSKSVAVGYATADDTAVSPDDYAAASSSLTFAPGETSKTVAVATFNDIFHEATETFTLGLTNPTNAEIQSGAGTATGTITDDDPAPTAVTLSLNPAAVGESAAATAVTVTASLNNSPLPTATTVTVSRTGGTATPGTDYPAVTDFVITIPAEQTSGTATLSFDPTGDGLYEGDETVILTGSVTGLTSGTAILTITDDDAAPTAVSLSLNPAAVGESATATTVTVTASLNNSPLPAATTVTVTRTGGTATSGTDYTAINAFTVTIPSGQTSGTATLSFDPSGDSLAEGDETVILTGTTTGLDAGTATLTITDDDTAPTAVMLSLNPSAVGESATATTVTVTASLNNSPLPAATTVTVTRTGGTATSGTDYTAINAFTVTIPSGQTSGTAQLSFDPSGDSVAEGDETVILTGSVTGLTSGTATLTITDDDAAPTAVSLSLNPAAVGESAAATAVTVTASLNNSPLPAATTVTVSRTGGTATSGTDYTAINVFTVTIPSGQTSGTAQLSFDPSGDGLYEGDETVILTGTVAGLDTGTATLTITDDDPAPTAVTLSLNPTAVGESAAATAVTVTASLNNSPLPAATTVTVSRTGGTATSGTDYPAVTDFVITIPAEQTSGTAQLSFDPTGDGLYEGDETVILTGSVTGLTSGTAILTITDDDAAPTAVSLSLNPAAVGESATATTVTVTASLNNSPLPAATTVTVSRTGGTATSATDYPAINAFTVTIPSGQTSGTATLSFDPSGDSLAEGDETVILTGTTTGLDAGTATLTITDDDTAPTAVMLSLNPSAVGESATATAVTVTASLNNSPLPAATTVTVSRTGGTATSGTDYPAVTDFVITIPAEQTSGTAQLSFDPTGDGLAEGDETVILTGSAAGLDAGAATLTITDDDAAPTAVSLSLNPAAVGESAAATAVTVTASLNNSPLPAATTVTVTRTGGTANSGTDYPAINAFTVTIPSGQTTGTATLSFDPSGDGLAEGDETVILTGSAAGLTSGTATLTITDDDPAPTAITLSLNPAAVGESAAATAVTVTASLNNSPLPAATTVTVSRTGGTATSATDYPAISAFTVTVPSGQTTGTATLSFDPSGDGLYEGDETVVLTGNAAGLAAGTATLTITDDDPAPTAVTLSLNPAAVGESAAATTVTVTASLNNSPLPTATTVTVSRTGGTATSGTDYTAINAFTVTVPSGQTSGTAQLSFDPSGDSLAEGDETVILTGSVSGLTSGTATLTITDDDPAPTAITLSLNPAAVGESAAATAVTVTASLNNSPLPAATTVTVSRTGGTATSATDYPAISDFTITIPSEQTSGTATLSFDPSGDGLAEGDETVILTGSVSGLTSGTATLTITDDDTAPTAVTLSLNPSAVGESATATAVTVTASLNNSPLPTATTVTVNRTGGTASSGTDYPPVTAFTVTVPAGQTSGTAQLSFDPIGDSLAEGDETVILTGSVSGLTSGTATLTITDDDPAPTAVTLSLNPAAVGESAAATTVTVTASLNNSPLPTATTVTVSRTGGTASSGTDYTAINAFTVTIPAGQTSGTTTLSFDPSGDSVAEGDETVILTGSVSGLTSGTATLTITDDDPAPTAVTLSLNPTAVGESAAATAVTVTASLNNSPLPAATTVTVSRTGGTATSGTDYTAINAFTVTIPSGQTSGTAQLSFDPSGDGLYEGDETVILTGTVAGLDAGTATLTITDDDPAPTAVMLSLNPTAVGESAAATAVTVTASLNNSPLPAATTVTVSRTGGTATSGTDYPAVTDFVITIPAEQTSGTAQLSFDPSGDNLAEGDETVILTGSAAGLDAGTATLTITDDDAAPTAVMLSLNPAAVGESAAATAVTVTASLNGSPLPAATTVTVSRTGGTATSATDYPAISDFTVTIPSGQTSGTAQLSFDPRGDGLAEGDETVILTGTTTGLDAGTATLTITDDDAAPTAVMLSLNPAAVGESAAATAVTVTASLNNSPLPAATTVTVSRTGGTATSGTDYPQVSAFTVTIPAEQTSGTAQLSFDPTGDGLAEGDETVILTGSAAGLDAGAATLTITDDDPAPTAVTLSLNPSAVGESAAATAVTVTASLNNSPLPTATTVTVSRTGGTANSGTDYPAINAFTVTIPSGQTTGTATLSFDPTGDGLAEGDETVILTGSAAGLTSGTATVTITDDDPAPTAITLSLNPAAVGESAAATAVTVTASLNNSPLPAATTVTVTRTRGTATSGTDYPAIGDFTVTIQDGQTSGTAQLSFDPTGDGLAEGDETVILTGSAAGLTSGTATLTITDDDAAPTAVTLSLNPAAVGESATATGVTVTASLNGSPLPTATTVTVSRTGGTATSGTDYTAINAFTVTIPSEQTSGTATLSFDPTGDGLAEGDETVILTGSATGLDDGTATLTITDDDAAPTAVTLSLNPSAVGESATATAVTVTASLNNSPLPTATTVTVTRTGGTATSGTDYTAINAFTVTVPSGQTTGTATLSFDPTGDGLYEGDETVILTGSAAGLDAGTATLTITDDDAAPTAVTLSVSPNVVGENATMVTVTASLNNSPLPTATAVTVSVTGGTATSGTDYPPVSDFTVTIQAGQSSGTAQLSFNPTEDGLTEDDETVILTGSATGLTAGTATLTITDNNTLVTFGASSYTVSEGAGATVFVDLSTAPTAPVTILLTKEHLGGATGTDYSGVPPSVTFTTEQTQRTFTVTATDDSVDDEGESLLLGFGPLPEGFAPGSPATARVILMDNDMPPPDPGQNRCPSDSGEIMVLVGHGDINQAGQSEFWRVEIDPGRFYVIEVLGTNDQWGVMGEGNPGNLTLSDPHLFAIWSGDGSEQIRNTGMRNRGRVLVERADDLSGFHKLEVTSFQGNTGTYQIKMRVNNICVMSGGNAVYSYAGGPDGYVWDTPSNGSTRDKLRPHPLQNIQIQSLLGDNEDWYWEQVPDEDWFAIEGLKEDHEYTIDVWTMEEELPLKHQATRLKILGIYDSNGMEAPGTSSAGSGKKVSVTFQPQNAGTFYVSVGSEAPDRTGVYRIRISAVALQVSTATEADTLTAALEDIPANHDGSSAFTFRIAFSEEVNISRRSMRDHALAVAGGTVTDARRVDGRKDLWELTVEPAGTGPVSILVRQDRACTETGALCTADGRMLSTGLGQLVPGPAPSPATEAARAVPNNPATGQPVITGTLQVGKTLTVDTSGISDQDGLENATFTYRWIAADSDIKGSIGSSHTIAEAQEGRAIRVSVSFTDDGGNEETLTSAATTAVLARPNTAAIGAPSITGTAQVGDTLSADTSAIADADGLTNVSFSYQWIRNDGSSDSDVTGATDSTYSLDDADEGRTIKVKVGFTDDAGSDESLASAATASVAARPNQSSAPDTPDRPVGTAVFVGGVDLEWNDVPGADSYDVQLFRNEQWTDLPGDGVEIAFYGAGAIISELDPSSTYWFQVRAGNAHGSSDWSNFRQVGSTNQSTLGQRARPDNVTASGAPVINGTVQAGESLTADAAEIEDGNGLHRVQFRFQWVSNDGSGDAEITGATDSSHTLVAADEGKTVKVRVSFTDRGGYAESLTSAATAAVDAAPNNPATGAPTITGAAQVGETLTADTSGIADADGLSNVTYSYQWIANDGSTDTDIAGATDSTYTLVAAEEGRTVKIRVFFSDDAGNGETLTSAATAAVDAAPNNPATGAPSISGTAQVGETLTAHTSGIADTDGLTNVSYGYQWVRNDGSSDTDITGATDSTYTLAAADEGRTIKIKVSFTDDADNEETLTSAPTALVQPRPNLPVIRGMARVGETLTADTSDISDPDGLQNAVFAHQWVAGGADIEGATGSSYTIAAGDEGLVIQVWVSFTDDGGNLETRTSAGTEVVEPPPNTPATGAPTITGTVKVGETLTADTSGISDAEGVDDAVFTYRWMAGGTDIQDATGASYTLTGDDEGLSIQVWVSFTDDGGNPEALTSAATGAVAPRDPPPAPGNLTAVENADGSVTLTWDAPDDDSVTGYQILRRIPANDEHPLSVYVEDTGSDATSYTDTGVAAGTKYVYRVKAINEAGVGPKSRRVMITTSG